MARSKKIKDEEYVQYVKDCLKEAEDASTPDRKVWKELWQLYQNRQDYSKKAGWQSKCFIPKIFMEIEKASGEVKRAVIQTRKLFKLELDDFEERQQIAELEDTIRMSEDPDQLGQLQLEIQKIKKTLEVRQNRMVLAEKRFKRDLMKTNLTNIYSEMVKPAFLLGIGVPKALWDTKRGRAKFENVDRMNVYISPDFMPFQSEKKKYIIEHQEMDLAYLKRLVKDNKEFYKSSEVKKIEEDFANKDKQTEERKRRGLGDYSHVSKRVKILQFWGDFISKDDDIEENVLMVVANDKYLIRKQANPFEHKKDPYPLTIPMVYPHKGIAGNSLVAALVKLQYAVNNMFNLGLDNLNFSVNKIFEYNPSSLQNPQSMTAIYPGKKIETNVENQVIHEVQVTPIGKDLFGFMELADKEMQEGSNVNEFIQGRPGKKTKTLGEVELKTAQSRGLFDVIARDLEENSLRPLLEMAYDLYAQYDDNYEQREGNYIFSVGGLSLLIMQNELVDRVGQILSMSLQSPEIGEMTDIQDLYKKMLSIYNLSDVYVEPESTVKTLTPQQSMAVQQKAEQDAKQTVGKMSPEEITRMAG